MHAAVTFRLADGAQVILTPGDLIGRLWTAALRLDDPFVSEAHALVSLRGDCLKLLALRGRFLVDGAAAAEAELRPGQRIQLSPETELTVDEVLLPDAVLAIEAPGLPRQTLTGACSLHLGPPPRLRPGAHPGADAVFWTTGEGWRVRTLQAPARALDPGDTLTVGPLTVHAVRAPLGDAALAHTRHGLDAPLHLACHYDSVHIHRTGAAPLLLTGQPARLLTELAEIAAPVEWEPLARTFWPDGEGRDELRRRWDILLVRLRRRLRAAGIRPELVHSTRGGLVELVLQAADTVTLAG